MSVHVHRTLFFVAWLLSFLFLLSRLDDHTPPWLGIGLVFTWPAFYNAGQYFVFRRRPE